MKKLLLISLIAFSINAKTQIVFEHAYDSAATYNNCFGNLSQLMIVNFEVSGELYVKIDRCSRLISIYDLDHNFVKSISLADVYLSGSDIVGTILYFSENLFDTDPGIEFMYLSDAPGASTIIYNEDGSILFSEDGTPFIIPNIHLQQYPIYNTSAGTKMILSYIDGQAKVFSLPGTLTTAMEETNQILMQNQIFLANPYPNPTPDITTIDYKLPVDMHNGEIILYDLSGIEIQRFKVDNALNSLTITTEQIPAGTYYYQLETKTGKSGSKKLIVVK